MSPELQKTTGNVDGDIIQSSMNYKNEPDIIKYIYNST